MCVWGGGGNQGESHYICERYTRIAEYGSIATPFLFGWVCAWVWGGGGEEGEGGTAHHNPLSWCVLIYKHMVGDLAIKWVHIHYSLAVPL